MEDVFGPVYARSLASDMVIGGLGGRTAQQALDGGEAPRAVWEAVCEATGQDDAVRYLHRLDPKERRQGRPRPRG